MRDGESEMPVRCGIYLLSSRNGNEKGAEFGKDRVRAWWTVRLIFQRTRDGICFTTKDYTVIRTGVEWEVMDG